MSATVDSRVVEMKFDNRQFESNVGTSMSTLDKLKQSLNFKGASKGFENISSAANGVNMGGLGSAVESVSAKFSALQVIGVTALANITNSAVNAGKRMVSALTIDPIKTGFNEYELKMNSVQTIMSNTASKGTTMADVTATLDELNTYADKTIYNFGEMTRNIGTFTAAGVGLEDSASAIKGIANLAAASGSSSQQASTAMYQLSQALSTGTVKLMDWNSVVNAGMGGEKFQEALKATAREHGVAVDSIIEKNGSFRDSLQDGWLSADILNETLNKFTVDGAKNYAQSMMESGQWTQEQADALMKEAQAMEDAATKVKTFTQLWDTLKEAAQSGWSQSWEIIVGDFEEAKELFSEISDALGGLIGKSAESRNAVLQGWKDLGGRTAIIDALRNTFEGLASIIKPISEAFREIFPPITAQQLYDFSVGLRDLTAKLKISDDTAAKLKSTFKGVFAAFDIVLTVIKALAKGAITLISSLTGISGGILGITGTLGDWISNLRDSIKETDIFGKIVGTVTGFITGFISKIKEFGSSLKDNFIIPNADGIVGFFNMLWDVIKQLGSGAVEIISSIGSGIAKAFGETSFMDVLQNGLFAGVLLNIKNFTGGLSDAFEGGVGALDNIKGILDDVRGCLQAYQDQLKAGTLQKIAIAIGILAASLFVISTIDGDALARALSGMTVLFVELVGALTILSKMSIGLTSVYKSVTLMIGISIAVLILAGALKKLAGLKPDEIINGIVGIAGMVAILVATAKVMDGSAAAITKFAGQMIILSVAIAILASVAKRLSGMKWEELATGGTGILGIVTILVAASKIMDSNSASITKFAGQMLIMSLAIGVLAVVGKQLSSMSWDELKIGGAALLGLVTMLVAASKIMNLGGGSTAKFAGQMILLAAALAILTPVLKSLANMTWEEIGRGLTVLGGALAELAIGLTLMTGTLAGSAALLVASAALAILTPVLLTLGGMSWESIAKGLIAIAGAFAIFGLAGLLLTPVIPAMLGLAAAFALFGLSMIGIGTGLTLIGIGLTSIAAAGVAAATSLVAAITVIITGILDLIPTIIDKIKNTIVAICTAIGESAPMIADTFLKVISQVLASLVEYTPQIADSLFSFLIVVFQVLTERAPELVNTLVDFLVSLINAAATRMADLISAGVTLFSSIIEGIFQAIGPIIETVIGPLLQTLGDILVGLVEAIAPYIPTICESFNQLAQTVADAIVRIVEAIAPYMPEIQAMVEATSSAIQSICSAFISLISQISPIIDSITQLVKQLGDSISQVFQSVADVISTCGDTISQILTSVGDVIDSVFTGISDVITSIGDAIKSVLDGIAGVIESIGESAKNAGEGFESLANGVKTITDLDLLDMGASMAAVAVALAGITAEAGGLAEAGAGMKQIADGTTISATAFNTMGSGITTVVSSLALIGPTASIAMSVLVTSVISSASCFSTMSSAASAAASSIISSFASIGSSVVSIGPSVSGISGAFSAAMSGVVSVVAGASGQISAAFARMMATLAGTVRSYGSTISAAFTAIMSGALAAVVSRTGMFMAAGVMLMTMLRTGLLAGGASIPASISSILSGCVSIISGHYSSFYGAGVFLGVGLIIGIRSQVASAYSAGFALGQAAVQGEKDGQQSKSPSKATKKAGKWLGQGLVIGINEMSKSVYKAGYAMGETAVGSISKTISKVSDVINSDIDSQPTIRPIIDLTDVKSGTNAINKMFDGKKSIDLNSKVGSISSMMNNNQNGASNDDVVSAINKLNKNLGNIGGNTYSINGVTYDDGSNISEAVKSLVRAARIERRV